MQTKDYLFTQITGAQRNQPQALRESWSMVSHLFNHCFFLPKEVILCPLEELERSCSSSLKLVRKHLGFGLSELVQVVWSGGDQSKVIRARLPGSGLWDSVAVGYLAAGVFS